MQERDSQNNPNQGKNHRIIRAGLQEIAYGFTHLQRSFEQRRRLDVSTAADFLAATRAVLPEDNPYFTKTDRLFLKSLSKGFHTMVFKVFNHRTASQWVMKLGMPKSPIRAPHPSSEEYTAWYSEGLDQQRRIFQEELPYLIPEPQTVLNVEAAKHGSTTVILQPFIPGVRSLHKIGRLPKAEKQTLLEELHIFKRLFRILAKETGLQLDFLRAGSHFVIGQIDGKPHLVFLDNGLFDRESTPVFFGSSRVAGSLRIRIAELFSSINRDLQPLSPRVISS